MHNKKTCKREQRMKLLRMKKVRDGNYLKNYEITYMNKAGIEKTYEIVSRRELDKPEDLGKKINGVSIIGLKEDKLLLLKEFRMGVNKQIYNLCAGMLEEGETIEACVERELYEETGLKVERILEVLPASYAAVAVSDIKTHIVFAEVTGEFEDHTSYNEEIKAGFFTKEEVLKLLKTDEFSSRAQMAAFIFAKGDLRNIFLT